MERRLAAVPRITLVDSPTPLERLHRIGAEIGHEALYDKRDDVMALGLGGNKLRSLEVWIGEALEQGCDTLLVAGQTVSNQCRLTAAAAAKLGLACVILHNADRPAEIEGNLLLNHLYGAEIFYLGPVDEAARQEAAEEKACELREAGRKPYIIGDPVLGVLGALGYVVAADELLSQASAAVGNFEHIVIPGSMGPTEAGFLYGLLWGGYTVRVRAMSRSGWLLWEPLHRYLAALGPLLRQMNPCRIPGQKSLKFVCPFDRHDSILPVYLLLDTQSPNRVPIVEAVKIDMDEAHPTRVLVDQGIRRTHHLG